jgi:hypothetical protein
MNRAKHTPAPWVAQPCPVGGWLIFPAWPEDQERPRALASVAGRTYATRPMPDPEGEANRDLIAAAPDLYAATERALLELQAIRIHRKINGTELVEEALSAVLRRARGEGEGP